MGLDQVLGLGVCWGLSEGASTLPRGAEGLPGGITGSLNQKEAGAIASNGFELQCVHLYLLYVT